MTIVDVHFSSKGRPNQLKIDLVTVRCMAGIAKVMGKLTIAEWVESEEVETILTEIGIDFVQGYFRHKPSPLNELLQP